jgi:hypothetical protein
MILLNKREECTLLNLRVLFFIAILLVFGACSSSGGNKDGVYDTRAVESLDKMCEVIGKINSCSYTLNTFVVEKDDSGNLTNFTNENDIYMRGPDKMYVGADGTRGEYGYWYNGKTLAFFSYDKNNYDTIDAPSRIIETIDVLHDKYGIDFPASDFFYPTLTDDIMEHFNEVLYFDGIKVDEVPCILITASSGEKNLQLWVEESTNLPYKVILAGQLKNKAYYEGTFSNWRINPVLPDILFEFHPPSNSTRVHIKERVKN